MLSYFVQGVCVGGGVPRSAREGSQAPSLSLSTHSAPGAQPRRNQMAGLRPSRGSLPLPFCRPAGHELTTSSPHCPGARSWHLPSHTTQVCPHTHPCAQDCERDTRPCPALPSTSGGASAHLPLRSPAGWGSDLPAAQGQPRVGPCGHVFLFVFCGLTLCLLPSDTAHESASGKEQ